MHVTRQPDYRVIEQRLTLLTRRSFYIRPFRVDSEISTKYCHPSFCPGQKIKGNRKKNLKARSQALLISTVKTLKTSDLKSYAQANSKYT